jgi:acetylornithine/N-succinyldiaminopimelate aminotransferase
MPVFGAPAISIERGAGTEVWDTDGRRYLDFLSGIAVTSLGHANPVVAEAICRQANTLLHVSNFFTNPQATAAAVKVNELLLDATGHPGQIFFTNSGAESNECALKLARKFGGAAATPWSARSAASTVARSRRSPPPGSRPSTSRSPRCPKGSGTSPGVTSTRCAAPSTASVAAIIIEPIQGEGGVHPAPPGYLQGIRDLCDEVGALMIVDEIQTGFARTGRWFGFEHDAVCPDVVTLAKAMGNGMPVGACWARTDVAAVFQPGDHGSTYSGTALATARRQRRHRRDAADRRPGVGRSEGRATLATARRPAPGRLGPWPGAAARRPARRRHRRPAVYRELLGPG